MPYSTDIIVGSTTNGERVSVMRQAIDTDRERVQLHVGRSYVTFSTVTEALRAACMWIDGKSDGLVAAEKLHEQERSKKAMEHLEDHP